MKDIRHLQLVILEIMKEIDRLCKENGIEYYLAGGSAIGAIRHHGFIPWDDDLDIFMTHDHYQLFEKICDKHLDKDKYFFQKGGKDWNLSFSKIRLKGTHIEEIEGDKTVDYANQGIWVDVFKLDNLSNNRIIQVWQYFCAKLHLTYDLRNRTYTTASFGKKVLMKISGVLSIGLIEKFIKLQITKYNNSKTNYVGFFFGRTRLKNAVIPMEILGKPLYLPFEDTMFTVPEQYHKYLTMTFGDYMILPPRDQQKPLHSISIDFGIY